MRANKKRGNCILSNQSSDGTPAVKVKGKSSSDLTAKAAAPPLPSANSLAASLASLSPTRRDTAECWMSVAFTTTGLHMAARGCRRQPATPGLEFGISHSIVLVLASDQIVSRSF